MASLEVKVVKSKLGTQHIQECCVDAGLVLMFSLRSLLLQYHTCITSSLLDCAGRRAAVATGSSSYDPILKPFRSSSDSTHASISSPSTETLMKAASSTQNSSRQGCQFSTQPRSLLDILSCIIEMSVTEWFLSLQLCHQTKRATLRVEPINNI